MDEQKLKELAIKHLESEIERLNGQLSELRSMKGGRRGRPPGKKTLREASVRPQRTMSAKARRVLSERMKARWAAARASGSKSLNKVK